MRASRVLGVRLRRLQRYVSWPMSDLAGRPPSGSAAGTMCETRSLRSTDRPRCRERPGLCRWSARLFPERQPDWRRPGRRFAPAGLPQAASRRDMAVDCHRFLVGRHRLDPHAERGPMRNCSPSPTRPGSKPAFSVTSSETLAVLVAKEPVGILAMCLSDKSFDHVGDRVVVARGENVEPAVVVVIKCPARKAAKGSVNAQGG